MFIVEYVSLWPISLIENWKNKMGKYDDGEWHNFVMMVSNVKRGEFGDLELFNSEQVIKIDGDVVEHNVYKTQRLKERKNA